MRGSSWPLTVAAYTPPTAGGVGVACGVGVAAALALAVGEAVPAPGFAGALEVGVGEVEEQAVPMIHTRATSAARRKNIGGECRPSRREAGARVAPRPQHGPAFRPGHREHPGASATRPP